MAQTILTLGQLIEWKLNGFVQLDLFPEELEQAKREQFDSAWVAHLDREEARSCTGN